MSRGSVISWLESISPRTIARLLPGCVLLISSAVGAAEPVVAPGITEAVCDVTLSASVAGIVSAWHFKEGDFVKEREAIIDLDKNLEELEVARRKAVWDGRRIELEALQSLLKKDSISVKKEDVQKAETEFKIASAEYEMAAEQLRRRSISAPCAGFIAELFRHVGEACQPYQPLIRVVDTRRCYFVSNVEAHAAARLKLDQAVKLETDLDGAPVTIQGKVVFLSPVVDPASGLQKVRVLFDNTDGKVRPGIAGRLYIE